MRYVSLSPFSKGGFWGSGHWVTCPESHTASSQVEKQTQASWLQIEWAPKILTSLSVSPSDMSLLNILTPQIIKSQSTMALLPIDLINPACPTKRRSLGNQMRNSRSQSPISLPELSRSQGFFRVIPSILVWRKKWIIAWEQIFSPCLSQKT